MPTVKITASQTVYYEKTLDLPQDEYEQLMILQDDGGWMTPLVEEWLSDGEIHFTTKDITDRDALEDVDIYTA